MLKSVIIFIIIFLASLISYYIYLNSITYNMSLSSIRNKNSSISLPNKHAIVVGGTSGIGMGMALRLSKSNIDVTIVGRNNKRGLEIVEEMKVKSNGVGKYNFIECDTFLLNNVKNVVDKYTETNNKLDYLILTQGMATIQGRTETSEGIDQKLALHYFSRVTFMKLLAPLLNQSEDPRVVSVLSGGVHTEYQHWENDFELKDNYTLPNAANAAGLYNDIAVDSMSRENPKISYTHIAPGVVATNWGTEMPWYLRGPIRGLMGIFGQSTEDNSEIMCDPIFDSKFKAPGFHIMNQANVATTLPIHEIAREKVWSSTNELIKRILKI